MSWKVIAGCLVACALVAIFYFHSARKAEAPKPAPVIETPVAVPLPTPKPALAKPVAPKPVVVPKKVVVGPPMKITPAAVPKKPLDMSISCRAARAFVAGKSPAELQRDREVYHTTDEQIAQYRHCF